MKVMMLVKANEDSEAGVMPSEALLGAMASFHEELVKAGVLLDLAGLTPSSKGKRVVFSGSPRPKVVDGPFTETKELVGGYWILQVKSMEEAVEWAKRLPFGPDTNPGGLGEIEIRPIIEIEDFAPAAAIEYHREVGEALEGSRQKK